MSEFQSVITIDTPAQTVFEFISDVSNLPKYLPTMSDAELQGSDRVHVHGEAHGHSYDSDGFWTVNQSIMRVSWGSDEDDYQGAMQVTDAGDGKCQVSGTLRFQNRGGDGDAQQGLEASLRSLKEFCERRGTAAGASGGAAEGNTPPDAPRPDAY